MTAGLRWRASASPVSLRAYWPSFSRHCYSFSHSVCIQYHHAYRYKGFARRYTLLVAFARCPPLQAHSPCARPAPQTALQAPLRRTLRHAPLCVRARGHHCNRNDKPPCDPMQLEQDWLDGSELDQPQQQGTTVPAAGQPLAGGVKPSAPVLAAAAAAGGSCGAAAMRQPPGVGGVMLLGCGEEGEFRSLQELFDDWACTADGEI